MSRGVSLFEHPPDQPPPAGVARVDQRRAQALDLIRGGNIFFVAAHTGDGSCKIEFVAAAENAGETCLRTFADRLELVAAGMAADLRAGLGEADECASHALGQRPDWAPGPCSMSSRRRQRTLH
jgi:hypothetical protein